MNAGQVGKAVLIDVDEAPIVEQQLGFRREQTVGARAAPDRDDQLIAGNLLRTVLVLVVDVDTLVGDRRAQYPRTEANVETLGVELLERVARDLRVGHAEKAFLRFEQNHFRPESLPDAAEFESDYAGANDAESRRYLFE